MRETRALADRIEAYLLRLLDQAAGMIEVRRCDLAEHFSCVPSQINYVLTTRFTTDRGYVVESRRGGSGYIRIVRVEPAPAESRWSWVLQQIGETISRRRADSLLAELVRRGWINERQAIVTRHMLERETTSLRDLEPEWQDLFRAALLRSLLAVVLGGA
ncbi:MAG TPA: CtsR family transcriptional regulator [Firmicutes bacterium]|nr:CtsR family transcriptional regulator [Bacillota bacterium]